MKKVLICIDNNAYSIKVANEGILIAKNMNAEISFLHVIDITVIPEGENITLETIESRKIKARKFLERILSLFSSAALIYVEEGDPGKKIIEKGEKLGVDMIIIGNNPRKGKVPGRIFEDVTGGAKNPIQVI